MTVLEPRISFRLRFLPALALVLLGAMTGQALAEGTAQVGLNQPLYEYGFTSALILDGDRPIYVDIEDVGEVIRVSLCGDADDDNVEVEFYNPSGMLVYNEQRNDGTITCNDPLTGTLSNSIDYVTTTTGTYELRLINRAGTRIERFDVFVAEETAPTTLPDPSLAQGRVWAEEWAFNAQGFSELQATDANFYILVPGGRPSTNYVWLLDLNNFAGFVYNIVANDIGINPPNSGISVPRAGNSVTRKYPVYLSYPPNAAAPPVTGPSLTNLRFIDDQGVDNSISPSATPTVQDAGFFEFMSDVPGNYSIFIDTNGDGMFAAGDRQLLGLATAGGNQVPWDGTDALGATLPLGTYNFRVQLRMGEYHFIANDAETSGGTVEPGLTLFQAFAGGATSPTQVYWDDNTLLGGTSTLPDGASSALPAGRHTWGDFTDMGFGNENFIDTYTFGLATEDFAPVVISADDTPVLDTDGDGFPDSSDVDDDGDGILDTDEGNGVTDTDTDGLPDSLDIDADGDGIPDNIEGQTSAGYIAPAGMDADGDGLDDAYDADSGGLPFVPTDTNTDTEPDYLDLDSDGDGVPDTIEGHDANMDGVADTAPAGTDADNDGLDDNYDNVTGPNPLTNSAGSNAPLQNTDGVDERDWRDTDDDNDGIPTSGEDANTNGNWADDDVDSDGTPDYLDAPDADGDGVPDAQDVDDDGDGILDTVEGSGVTDTDTDGLPDSLDIDADGDGIPDNIEGQTSAGYIAPTGNDTDNDGLDDAYDADNGGTPFVPTDTNADTEPDYLDSDSDGDGVPDTIEGHDANMDGVPDTAPAGTDADNDGLDDNYDNVAGPNPLTNPAGTNAPLQNTDGVDERDWRDTDDDNDGIPTSGEDANTNGNWADDDSDGDGTPDYLDALDSDGDGLPDYLDIDDDGDGILDTVEGSGVTDTDTDGLPDSLDIDADGDGIPDNIEGQTSAGYIAPTGIDTDNDGLDDAYDADNGGTPFAPTDTNTDTEPDYLDSDSDGDGVPDMIEGHDANMDGVADTAPAGTDADNDGLDDNYDNVAGPNPLTNPAGSNAPLQNTDGVDERDWRDTDDDNDGIPTSGEDANTNGNWADDDVDSDGTPDYLDAPDADGDGVPDAQDLDDDGDGILDTVEGNGVTDTDTDGLPDSLDIDADGDGIPDNIEGQTSAGYIAPTGIDTDGDGLDNAYDSDDGGTPFVPTDTNTDTEPDYLDTDSDGDGVPDTIEGHDANMDGVADTAPAGTDADNDGLDDNYDNVTGPNPLTNPAGTNAPLQNTDGVDERDWRDTDDDNDGIPTSGEDANTNGNWADDDADSDGTPDYLDIFDTDGDGIPDNVDVDDDGDGILDTVEGSGVTDTDTDGLPDSLDIDADGDGIPDNIEGQTSAGYTAPTGIDTDGDGLDNAYDSDNGGTPFAPTDTNTDTEPDYLDSDSDGDGVPDTIEGHDANMDGVADTAPAGTDADNDGLDDNYDNVTGPNPLTNPAGSNAPLQNTDGVDERDWRDTDDDNDGIPTSGEDGNTNGNWADDDVDSDGTPDYLDAPDADGDGVPDAQDVDDDGDGILDTVEGSGVTDTDTDGLPDSLDIDADGDGIPDNIEGQTSAGYIAPTGIDTDNDGLDDAYDADNGGTPFAPTDTNTDTEPDYLDSDSDGDGVPDTIEGHDANMDGVADTAPAGTDADNDGLDDNYDNVTGPNPLTNPAGTNAPLQNTDGVDERDWRDTDDDNDGIPTSGEDANTNGNWADDDGDGDGTPDYLDIFDTDGDGIPDNVDVDDDGDGILDTVEGSGVTDTDTDGLPDSLDIDADGDGIPDNIEGQTSAGYIAPTGMDTDGDGLDNAYDSDDGGTPFVPTDTNTDTEPDYLDSDSDGDGVPDTIEGHDANMDGVADTAPAGTDADNDGLDDNYDNVTGPNPLTNPSGSNAPLQNTDGVDERDWRDTDDDNDGIPTSGEDANTNGNWADDDADSDGTPDYLDIFDTDGDGIPDNVDVDDDGDGILDTVEGSGVTDTDTDGLPDSLDIDADGDGIPDNIEGQTSAGYIAPTGIDTDGDGLDNAYDSDDGGTPFVPTDTNTDTEPDYLDSDSDGDGVPDTIEGHDANMDGVADTAPAGTDADNDGLDDNYDNVAGPNPLTNPAGTNAPLQNTDGVDERDWRDTDDDNDGIPTSGEDANTNGNWADDDADSDGTPDYLDIFDTDGDGIPDNVDVDDDGDGILDTVEGSGVTDTDTDGLPDSLDIDADGDGIPDNIEGQTSAGYIAPTGNDTDNDGLDDAYDADNGGTPFVPTDTNTDTEPDYLDSDSDGDGVPDTIEGHDANMDGVADTVPAGTDADNDGLDDNYDNVTGPNPLTNPAGTNAPLQNTDGVDERDWRDTNDDNDGIPTSGEDANTNGNWADDDADSDGTPDYLDSDSALDTDGDGIPNSVDIDDDGDGILDTDEGGGVTNTDGDAFPDSLDIDADGDGIPDNIEGQTSAGYIAPTGIDTDGDGLDNAYDADDGGTPFVPTDTNTDTEPDYLDSDSDGDGVPDTIEGHDANMDGVADTAPAGTDADNDGLDDNYDNVAGPNPLTNPAGSNAPLQNTDGVDERDWRDTDDDNDGIPTSGEDGNSNGNWADDDVDSDGTPDYLDAGDTDGDGVPDALDVDDDGDGILDTVEGNGVTDTDTDGLPDSLDIDADGDGIPDNIEGQTSAGYIAPTGIDTDGDGLDNAYDSDNGGTPFVPTDTDTDTEPDYLDSDSDGDGVPDTIEGHDANVDGVADTAPAGTDADNDGLDDNYDNVTGPNPLTNPAGTNAPLQNTDGIDERDWRDTDDDNDGIPTSGEDANTNGNWADDDADSDGTPDYLDIFDTDGDGIPDNVDVDDDGDGILDTVEGGGVTNTDGDAFPDSLDIDADGDGIPDNIEGQTSAGYIAPTGNDTDNDGLDDAYDADNGGTPFVPTDTNTDTEPDYLDSDSDGDGVPDTIEGHDANMDGVADAAPAGTDADNDGLDDNYDNVTGPNPLTNPAGTNAPLQNTDGVDERDWRDTDDDNDGIPTSGEDANTNGNWADDDVDSDGTPDYLDAGDTDGDGVPDALDVDDDGDGILDTVEGSGVTDTDTDGVPDSLDIDADGDGIPDNIEGQTSAGYIAPTGMDTDGDGLDNAYDSDDGGTPFVPTDTNTDTEPDYLDSDSDGDGVPDTIEGHDANMDGVADTAPAGTDADNDGLDDNYDNVTGPNPLTNPAGTNAPLQNTDGVDERDWRDTDDDNDGIPTSGEDANTNGNWADDDADTDGTPDYLDPDSLLDSDGDGIPNSVDIDDDNDGILDTVEGSGVTDTDTDGVPDSLDIDADGDGIPDNIEAQSSAGYVAPTGIDTDNDGLDNAYDPDAPGSSPITPVDTDSDATPDYRDADSDGDGIPDAIEGNDADMNGVADTTPQGTDADNDGLDDAFDIVIGPNPQTNSTGSRSPLQNSDGTDERDWRDTDDDNDGIPTADEDVNANGNWTDDDADSDGIPDYLDSVDGSAAILLTKSAGDSRTSIGRLVRYTLTAENVGGTPIAGVSLSDRVPAGFRYVAESAQLVRAGSDGVLGTSDDAVSAITPTGDRPIVFGGLSLADAESIRVRYVLQVGSGVTDGAYVNQARPFMGTAPVGNVASASVLVESSDPILQRTTIIGKVFHDINGNGAQDPGERGIPGARMATPTGLVIQTDASGRYHLADVDPGNWERGRNFILKLDPASLPRGSGFTTENPRVIRVTQGLMSRINFGVSLPQNAVAAIPAQGGANQEALDARAGSGTERITTSGASANSGELTGEESVPASAGSGNPSAPRLARVRPLKSPASNPTPIASDDPNDADGESAVGASIAPALAQLSVGGGGTLWVTEDPTSIEPRLEVMGPNTLRLIDGNPEPASFYLYTNYDAFIERWELVVFRGDDADLIHPLATLGGETIGFGVSARWDGNVDTRRLLRDGDELSYVLRVYDAQGRMDETVPRRIRLTPSATTPDAEDPFENVADSIGQAQPGRQTIPIRGSRVRIHGEGFDPDTQIQIDGQPVRVDRSGRVAVEQAMPPGERTLQVRGTDVQGASWQQELRVDVSSHYFFMVGIADITTGANDISGNIEPLSVDPQFDGTNFTDGRMAFYLKGKIKGKYLITAQLDTTEDDIDQIFDDIDREDPRQIFRRLDPDRYYPVYGDDSTTTSDVDTQGRFYLRMDWDNSAATWGNFNTNFTGTEFAEYNRSLYGASVQYRSVPATTHGDHRIQANAFSSQPNTSHGHNEFLGTGGSLYYLKDTDIVQGSEKAWIEVRGRDSGRVIERLTLERGRDYQIDEIQGRIILTRPLTQVADEVSPSIIRDTPLDGNDVLLLVDYEFIPGGFLADDMTYGGRVKGWATDHVAVGGTYVSEDRAGQDYELVGADAVFRHGRGTYLKAEFAQSEATQTSTGFGSTNGGLTFDSISVADPQQPREGEAFSLEARLSLAELTGGNTDATFGAWYRDRDAGFSTARTDIGIGVEEFGAEAQWRLNDRLSFAVRSSSIEREGKTDEDALTLQAEIRPVDQIRLTAEIRDVKETPETGPEVGGTLGAVKLGFEVFPGTEVYAVGQYTASQDAGYLDNNLFTVGVRGRIQRDWSVLAEASTGDRGDAARVGVDYVTASNQRVYANYTQTTDGRDEGRDVVTVGRRGQISNQVALFNESQFTHDERQAGVSHVFGLDYTPTQRWKLGFSVQSSNLDAASAGEVDRETLSLSAGYTRERSYYSGKVELREDNGATDQSQWLTTNRFSYRFGPRMTLVGNANLSRTQDNLLNRNDAQFIETGLGVAYRPASTDRLNLIAKYTYLYDLPNLVQAPEATDQRSHVGSVEGVFELAPRWELGLKLAHREGEIRMGRDTGQWLTSTADLAVFRLGYHFVGGWDGIAEYRWLSVDEANDAKLGALLGVYRHIARNFKLGVGYNFTEFTDNITDLDYDNEGWFINVIGKY